MNKTQLYLTNGIPTITVIFAWLSNRSDLNRLHDRVDKLGESLRGKIDRLSARLRTEMIGFRREVHQDLLMLHERVVKVETRQGV